MKLEIHLLTHDDEQMFAWAMRHWAALGAYVVVHDGGPKQVCSSVMAPGFKCVPWDTGGQLNDDLAAKLKNSCWKGTTADWVAVVDADELLYFPEGAEQTLERLEARGAAIARPHGFEMFAESYPEPSEHPGAQITDFVKDGAPDDKWYAKPILFSPRRVATTGFGIGAHESDPVFVGGQRFHVGADWPFAEPPIYLLHFKSIFGGLERIAERYDATRKRLAAVNVRHGWGNLKPGAVHAQEKRDLLLPHVRWVIV